MSDHPRARTFAISTAVVVVAVIVTAIAAGGSNSKGSIDRALAARSLPTAGTTGDSAATGSAGPSTGSAGGRGLGALHGVSTNNATKSAAVPMAVPTPANGPANANANAPSGSVSADVSSGGGVAATRVVKTGSMSLTVAKGQVQAAVSQLARITTGLGGYVSQSRTNDLAGSPAGEVTLRMPVNRFEATVSAAQKIGHQTSLTTNAHDVTGRYVDLGARLSALQRTRQTYLTILGRATTIGQTLSVQQRVDDVQQQIEQLQGELKVLRNQSADGTLTVDVAEAGAAAVTHPHHRSGLSKAWHTSIHRFSRGIDAIVGALGPLLLALILLGLAGLIVRLGLRRTRRATT